MTDTISRIMEIRDGMTTDADAEAIVRREISALQPHVQSSPVTTELLPCPFCGGEPRIDDPVGRAAGFLVGVVCTGCGSQSPLTTMWNMRKGTDDLSEEGQENIQLRGQVMYLEAEVKETSIPAQCSAGIVSAPALDALVLAEDVLSRAPFSTAIWPNGMHPQIGIDKIRDAIEAIQHRVVTDEMIERAEAAFYEQQEGPINFTAGMRAAIAAVLGCVDPAQPPAQSKAEWFCEWLQGYLTPITGQDELDVFDANTIRNTLNETMGPPAISSTEGK